MTILRLLKLGRGENSEPSPETVRKIMQRLDQLEPERAKFLAAFAYLLARAARADMRISLEETRAMERILVEHGRLPEEQAVVVIQMAKTQNMLLGGTENFLVSREFRKVSSREERLALLDCLYAVAASENLISMIEDNEISQIADELRIEHRDLIAIRLRYRSQLAVLRNPPTS